MPQTYELTIEFTPFSNRTDENEDFIQDYEIITASVSNTNPIRILEGQSSDLHELFDDFAQEVFADMRSDVNWFDYRISWAVSSELDGEAEEKVVKEGDLMSPGDCQWEFWDDVKKICWDVFEDEEWMIAEFEELERFRRGNGGISEPYGLDEGDIGNMPLPR